MKAALIPPKGYYHTAVASNYHLVLAQVQDHDYKAVYAGLPIGDYMILDNGAAEGQMVSDNQLVDAAIFYGADEVVIPDTLKDWRGTVSKMYAFMSSHIPEQLPPTTKYMFVAQGETIWEVQESIRAAREISTEFTIGIPRHLLTTFKNLNARMHVLNFIKKEFGELPVHLLGTNPEWPGEMLQIARMYPWVRGIDTSMPYSFSINHLDMRERKENVSRPEGYFSQPYQIMSDVLDRNIATYLEWANGTEGTGR